MPKAVLFQMSFCLLMYYALQVVAPPGSYQACEAKKISNEKLFYDVKRQMVAVSELVEVDSLLALLGEVPTAAELRECMREGLPGAWSDRWWKAPLRPWWASEGEDARTRQPYVDSSGSRTNT